MAAVFPCWLSVVAQIVESYRIVESLNPTDIHIHLLERREVAVVLVFLAKLVFKITHTGTWVAHDEIVEIVMFGQQLVLQFHEACRRIFAAGIAAVTLRIEFGAMLKYLQVFQLLWWPFVLAPEGLVALGVLYGVDDVVVPHNPYLSTAPLQFVLAKIGALAEQRHGNGIARIVHSHRTEQGRLGDIGHGFVFILCAVEHVGEKQVDEFRLVPFRS